MRTEKQQSVVETLRSCCMRIAQTHTHTHIKKESSPLFQYKHRYNFIIMMYVMFECELGKLPETQRHMVMVQSLTEHNAEMPL